MIRIFIADDHRLVIDGLLLLLREAEDMTCVGQAANGREALEMLGQTPADVLLLDLNMPEMDGLECCRIARERWPDMKVLALSMMREISLVKAMLRYGASGFILKNAGKDELFEAIRNVHAGKQAFSQEILDTLMEALAGKNTRAAGSSPFPTISRREKEILQLIVD